MVRSEFSLATFAHKYSFRPTSFAELAKRFTESKHLQIAQMAAAKDLDEVLYSNDLEE